MYDYGLGEGPGVGVCVVGCPDLHHIKSLRADLRHSDVWQSYRAESPLKYFIG